MLAIVGTLSTGSVLMSGLFGNRSLTDVINIILALLIAIDVHELGHAVVATWLGDDTAKNQGHLSLNPFRHMDQFGIILLFLTAISSQGFTYGFTPVNEQTLRRRTQFGPAIVAAAGPLMNLVLAAVLAVPLTHGVTIDANGNLLLAGNPEIFQFVSILFGINVFLAVFNLVPFPPLDGWTIFSAFLTPRTLYNLRPIVQYGPMIILLLLVFEPQIHFFSNVITPATDWLSTQLFQL